MHEADIAIVGSGVAGALAAVMLGRSGHDVSVIDPEATRGPDFRCEKLEPAHVGALRLAGVLDEILPIACRYEGIWIGRGGRLVERRPSVEHALDYAALVNRLRSLVPARVAIREAKVIGAERIGARYVLELTGGQRVGARLVILAAGPGTDLPDTFGLSRTVTSRCHSISIGFDIAAPGPKLAGLGAVTWFGARPQDRVAYLTLFPMADRLRGNLFVYREASDPWLRCFRKAPTAVLLDSLPGLAEAAGPFEISGPLRLRPVDLVEIRSPARDGLIVVGDAFATACPVSGTGASKAMVDVERLCNVHVPAWFAAGDFAADRIADFYRDPVKLASDRHSRRVSLFARRAALGEGPAWNAYRWAGALVSRGRNAVNNRRAPDLGAAAVRDTAA